jgi:hypothetical protein
MKSKKIDKQEKEQRAWSTNWQRPLEWEFM